MINHQYVPAAELLFNALYAINVADGPEARQHINSTVYLDEATAYSATKVALQGLLNHIISHPALRKEFTDEWLPDNFGESFQSVLKRFEHYVNTGEIR